MTWREFWEISVAFCFVVFAWLSASRTIELEHRVMVLERQMSWVHQVLQPPQQLHDDDLLVNADQPK